MAVLVASGANVAFATDEVDGYIFRSSALCISSAPAFDVGQLDRMSAQVIYSSATNPAVSFNGGVKSTATITVGSNFALLANATAFATVKVSSNSAGALTGACITVQGYPFCEGTRWTRADTSTGTAASIALALDAYGLLVATASYGGTSSDTVRSSATVYGSAYNAYTIVSSTPAALVLSGATFSGGRDPGHFTINGVQLTQGEDWSVGASTAATATNIAAAINASSSLSAIVVATAPLTCVGASSCGIVRSTATAPGVNAYALSTSSYPILTPSGSIFQWGTASNINSANDTITKTNTFTLGMQSYIGGTAPTGLTANATYYAIPVLEGASFKLSDTSSGAVAGVTLDISTTAAGGGTYTLTPATTTTGASFVFEQSNDGVNWVTAVSTGTLSTITIGAPSGVSSAFYDFGSYNARFLRFNFTKPTRGGFVTDIAVHGKRD